MAYARPQPLIDVSKYAVADGLMFESDNEWDIPTLDIDMQATDVPEPFRRWGEIARTTKGVGTWCFYTDDARFNAIWTNPESVVRTKPACVVEPNYSTDETVARAEALWGIYRKRFLARWWQDAGIPVWVDLNIHPEHRDVALIGVPKGWQSYMTRGNVPDESWVIDDFELASEHADGNDVRFVVYGGSKRIRNLCRFRGWQWLPERSQVKEGRWDG